MATPIRNLNLIKNTISPNFLSVSPQYFEKYLSPSTSAKKQLEFSKNQTLVSKQKKENIIINTPTKIDLMKNGLCEKRKNVDILGCGGYGIVVKGKFKENQVAVKIIRLKKNYKISEINALNLSHKNLVKILEIVTNPMEKNAVIIMEYLERTIELQTYLEHRKLSKFLKKKFIQDICLGLQYCHENSILHLDIKPKNILIFNDDHCKICDFGNSCCLENLKNYEFQGTVIYSAPELLKGLKPTIKCDVYSLGITLWQMEYRKNPYEEYNNIQSVVYNVVKNIIRPKHQGKNDIFSELFQSCWHENPEQRPEISDIVEICKNL